MRRKYLGVVFRIGKYNYNIPMSSPKDSDYQIAGTNKVIKKEHSADYQDSSEKYSWRKRVKGYIKNKSYDTSTDAELTLYDLENEPDNTYKDLVQNEMIFIRKNREKIVANAKLLYKQKVSNDSTA